MEVAQFNKLIEEQIEDTRTRSGSKNKEYARGGDKLYNFRRVAEVMNGYVEDALWGMFIKHFVSIQDIVEDVGEGEYSTREVVDEKIGDAIVYLILLKAILIDEKHTICTKEEFTEGMHEAAKKYAMRAVRAQYPEQVEEGA